MTKCTTEMTYSIISSSINIYTKIKRNRFNRTSIELSSIFWWKSHQNDTYVCNGLQKNVYYAMEIITHINPLISDFTKIINKNITKKKLSTNIEANFLLSNKFTIYYTFQVSILSRKCC